MRLLAYYTIGFKNSYIELLHLSILSLRHFHPEIDIRVISDEQFTSEISEKIPGIQIVSRPNATSPEKASMQKLSIFNEDVSTYDVIIFIDSDILIGIPLSDLISKITNDEKLYAFAEKLDQKSHTELFWSLENYSKSTLAYFADNNILVFNAGLFAFRPNSIMKQHFQNVEEMVSTHTGTFFYEQSFMNVYFNTHNLVDYSVFTRDNYTMSPERSLNYNIISHFSGDPGDGSKKATRMVSYIRRNMPYIKIT